MFNSEAVSANIKRLRKSSGMSQSDLAERLFISAQSVSKWECGDSMPDVAKLCELSKIFHVSVDSILGIDDGGEEKCVMIGIDGGGTKTDFLKFSSNGAVKGRIVLGGTNPTSCGIEKTCDILKIGINSLLSANEELMGIFAGIAGLGVSKNAAFVKDFLESQYKSTAVKCSTDIFNVIGSVPKVGKCVAAICGTGSVVYAYDGKKLERVGGWGYLLDNGGSGYDIGRDALRAALAERDGIGKPSIITKMVEEKLGGSVWSNISRVYSDSKGFVASFAPIVFDAYRLGDSEARNIIEKNAVRIAELINGAADRHDCGETAVISGGLMNQKDIMVKMIKQRLKKPMEIIVPLRPQIYGACVQCCRMCGVDINGLKTGFDQYFKGDEENAEN